MTLRRFIAVIALVAFCGGASAQVMFDYLRAANDYYAKGEYNSAANYYEKYLKNNSKKRAGEYDPYQVKQVKMQQMGTAAAPAGSKPVDRQVATYKLADSYRKLNMYAQAIPWYKQAAEWHQQFPDAKYWYAVSLRANKEFEAAEAAFNDFVASPGIDDNLKQLADKEIASLRFINAELNKPYAARFQVNKLNLGINPTSTYAPVVKENQIFFTATTPDTAKGKKDQYNNYLFKASFIDGAVSATERVAFPDNAGLHEGVAAVTPDGSKMYLTRWSGTDVKKVASIYVADKASHGWSAPSALGADINVPEYSSQEPFVSPDGKYLFFASNMPGGAGKLDLYYVPLQDGNIAGKPVNLGSLNTPENEQAPFYHEKTKTFVFSSNGRVGMGGMDLYKATGALPASFSEPVNLGHPYNSVKDDNYFFAYGKFLYNDIILSSDRNSVCCYELLSLERNKLEKKITGQVINCKENRPLDSVTVAIVDDKGKEIANLETDDEGRYSFVMQDYANLNVTVRREGFIPARGTVAPPDEYLDLDSIGAKEICMEPVPIPEKKPLVLQNIYFEFAKADLKPESLPYLDSLAEFMKEYPTMVVELGGHTDAVGSDEKNMKLSEERAAAVVKYLTEKGIPAERMTSKGYGETQPVAPNKIGKKDNPAGREKNRRTEFKVLRYE